MQSNKLTLLLILLLTVAGLKAVGLGVTLNYGGENGEADYEFDFYDPYYDNKQDVDFNSTRWDVAFTFDSNVTRTSPFIYRMRFGYGMIQRHYKNGDFYFRGDYATEVFSKMTTEHAFGLKLYQRGRSKLWFGSSLLMEFGFSNEDHHKDNDEYERDSFMMGFGIGPVLGYNIAINESICIALELSAHFKTESGNTDYYVSLEDHYPYSYRVSADYVTHSVTYMLKFSPLMYFGER